MKNSARDTLPTVLALLALAGLAVAAASGTAWYESMGRVPACALVMLPLAAIFADLFRRLRNEDQITHLEAALCRERNARSQADQALAEADLLLARLAARSRTLGADPAGQMRAIHAELAQLQRQVAEDQPQLAQRLDQLCRRIDRAAASLRNLPRAAEPG